MKKTGRITYAVKHCAAIGCLVALAACGGGTAVDQKPDSNINPIITPINPIITPISPPVAFPLSVEVSGLTKSGLVLQNNKDSDLFISDNGLHQFREPVLLNHKYAVTVKTQPTDQICTVNQGSGIAVKEIPPIQVSCVSPVKSYTIGGAVSGLNAGNQVVLKNNDADPLPINTNKQFTFPTPVASNSRYLVTVDKSPIDQTCNVYNESGTVGNADVTNVSVKCTTKSFRIGVTVTGLISGKSLVLHNDNADPLLVTANESLSFANRVIYNGNYNVTVATQPEGQTCEVKDGVGEHVTADVSGIEVTCSDATYSISGTLTGLNPGNQITLKNNGGDELTRLANGTFTFKAKVGYHGHYEVTVGSFPFLQDCSISGGSGSSVDRNIDSVKVDCGTPIFSIFADFDGTNGGMPYGTMPFDKFIQARDGNFYGLVKNGPKQRGVLFKMTPTGSLESLHQFGNDDGSFSNYGGLLEGSDGNFYGVIEQGMGGRMNGAIFKMTPKGELDFIHTFNGAGDGKNPASLIQAKDGKTMYGTTSFGGANGRGTIFSITQDGNLKTLHAFTAAEGYEVNQIVEGRDGYLYGTTRGDGVNNPGSVFTMVPDGSNFSILHTFDAKIRPSSGLVEGNDGRFYGTTLYGGGYGSVYSITKASDFTDVHLFVPSEGIYLYSPLVKGKDGKLYGVTTAGGAYGRGTIFSITPETKEWATVYSFNPAVTGQSANAGFIVGQDGSFYGLMTEGGKNNLGAIFKFGTQVNRTM